MPLSNLGSLLPYHSHVRPEIVVGALNHMIDDASTGKPIFYDFYTEAEKQEQPEKRNTGLFFFRGKPGAPFAIIAPGRRFLLCRLDPRGFSLRPGDQQEGLQRVRAEISRGTRRRGRHAGSGCRDLVCFPQRRALGVGTGGYSLWGSSAGARMAAAIGSHGVASFGGDDLPKPSAVVMAYTAHSDHCVQRTADIRGRRRARRHLPSGRDGKACCGAAQQPARRSRITDTGISVTALDRAPARAPKDGSPTRSVLVEVCQQQLSADSQDLRL